MKFFKDKLLGPYILLLTVGAFGFFIDFQTLKAKVGRIEKKLSASENNNYLLCEMAIEMGLKKRLTKKFCITKEDK